LVDNIQKNEFLVMINGRILFCFKQNRILYLVIVHHHHYNLLHLFPTRNKLPPYQFCNMTYYMKDQDLHRPRYYPLLCLALEHPAYKLL